MMVKWGQLEVPELEYRPCMGGDRRKWPAEPGVVHLPTGMRLHSVEDPNETRGAESHSLLFSPPSENWIMRVIMGRGEDINDRLARKLNLTFHEFRKLPVAQRIEEEKRILYEDGKRHVCKSILPENDSKSMEWTEDRRDAFLLMMFWTKEGRGSERDPLPSLMHFRPVGVPEQFHGDFRNKLAMRAQGNSRW
jgi:hypothetical protein